MAADAPALPDDAWKPCPLSGIHPGMLGEADVQVWLASLILPQPVMQALAATLTDDERQRAGRFHFERDRQRFIAARGMLRQLLGACTAIPDADIRFSVGAYGKPFIASPAAQGVEFSLSHSGDLALIAVARGRAVGADIEMIRDMPDYRNLARNNFATVETASLLALPADRHLDGFFACWTRKEAYVKALGLGLSLDLASFAVSVDPTESDETVTSADGAHVHHVRGFRPPANAWAALAIEASLGAQTQPSLRLSSYEPPAR